MDCPKKGCDGQVEAWYKQISFCGVNDEGEPDYDWFEDNTEKDFEFIEFRCSQCDATWINQQQLLADRGEQIIEESKGGDHP